LAGVRKLPREICKVFEGFVDGVATPSKAGELPDRKTVARFEDLFPGSIQKLIKDETKIIEDNQ
jgi:hypothetical protein